MFRPGQPYGDRPAPRPELAPEIVQDLRMLIRSTPEAMEVGWNQQSLFRDDEVAQLAEIIDKPGSVLIISGPKRLGKSCEMKQLLRVRGQSGDTQPRDFYINRESCRPIEGNALKKILQGGDNGALQAESLEEVVEIIQAREEQFLLTNLQQCLQVKVKRLISVMVLWLNSRNWPMQKEFQLF